MKSILKNVLSVGVGLIAAFVLLMMVEAFSAVVYPVPQGSGYTPQEMCLYVANYPHWVLAAVVPMWGGTAFISVWLTRKIGSLGSAVIVGTLLLAAVIANIAMLPYPAWFKIASPLVALIAILTAGRPTFGRKPASRAVNVA